MATLICGITRTPVLNLKLLGFESSHAHVTCFSGITLSLIFAGPIHMNSTRFNKLLVLKGLVFFLELREFTYIRFTILLVSFSDLKTQSPICLYPPFLRRPAWDPDVLRRDELTWIHNRGKGSQLFYLYSFVSALCFINLRVMENVIIWVRNDAIQMWNDDKLKKLWSNV